MPTKTNSPQPQTVEKKNKDMAKGKKTTLPGMETSEKVKNKIKRATRNRY